MAGPGSVQVPPDSTGKLVDMVSATVGGVSVARQVFALANGADGQTIAEVVNASASTGAVGVVVRPTTATVALVAGTTVDVNGGVAISGTAQVAIATPIVINNISATTVVSGLLSVTGTVQVAIATPYVLQGISTTVQVAVGTPFVIQGISTSVTVVGSVGINSIGTVTVTGGVAISGTATVVNATASPLMIAALDATDGSRVNVGDSANTALRVNVVAGAAGGVSHIDGASFTAQQAAFVPVGGVMDDAASGALSEGDAGAVRLTSARAMHVHVRSGAGASYDNTAGDALKVHVVAGGTGGGTVTLSSGSITRISNTVIVAVATPYILQGISTTVQVAGTVNVNGGVAISGTAQVAIATPIVINNISATTIVAGAVSLAAGTANIGTLNDISRTVQVAVGTPFTINNISATTVVSGLLSVTGTVQVAIATPYTLQGISTTVQVAIATPYILQGISTTVSTVCNITAVSAGVAINTQARAPAVMSASRGPKCVTASTSANVTLIASPGAGANIYIKQIGVHNFSTTFTAMRVGTSASTQTIVVAAQSSGGGAVYNFDPPWMLSASEAALCSVKPNANYGVFNVQFYVI